jgi:hypothetical protein
MRNSRFAVALAAVACVVALPAAAAAHKGKPEQKSHALKGQHGHPGKLAGANVRLMPATGQTARGEAHLRQHANALSIELVVGKLAPGAFYGAQLHSGSCATPGAAVLTFPDVYADEHGVARLVASVPTAAGASYFAGGYALAVHAGPSASATPVISCGDIAAKTAKSAAKAWLKGAGNEHGHAELVQKGSDVSVWLKASGLTPGAHALQLIVGSCAAPGAVAVSLGDVTAGPDGTVFAKVAATSTIPVVGKGYALAVNANPSATPGATVACGDLNPLRWGWRHK